MSPQVIGFRHRPIYVFDHELEKWRVDRHDAVHRFVMHVLYPWQAKPFPTALELELFFLGTKIEIYAYLNDKNNEED